MSVLRVVVVRSGGFAGLTRKAEVDDPEEAGRLTEALRTGVRQPQDDRTRDGFVYEITVTATSGTERLALGESALPPGLRSEIRALFTE